jgi:hypothetical protein
MDNSEQVPIAITLSATQVDEVVRAASQSRVPSLSTLISDSLRAPLDGESESESSPAAASPDGVDRIEEVDEASYEMGYLPAGPSDPRLSRSLVRGLSLLTCFPADGSGRGVVELAHEAGMSPSTAHRYASTLVELGLLERNPKSRKYRLRRS